MRVPLSARAFRLVDGASKAVAVVAVAAALNGAAAPNSFAVGVFGFALGAATVFLSPRGAAATDGKRDDGDGGWRPVTGAAKTLWRTRLARVGAACWLVAFLVAGAGVVLRETGRYALSGTLLAVSGPLGLAGMLVLAAAGVAVASASLRE